MAVKFDQLPVLTPAPADLFPLVRPSLGSDGSAIATYASLFNNINIGQLSGTGSPEGVVTGNPGNTYWRTDGTNGRVVRYLKVIGTGNTGWSALQATYGMFNIEDYGAKTGIANASANLAAINDAVADAALAGGGVIVIPNKQFYISASITVTTPNILFIGQGPASIIQTTSVTSATLFYFNSVTATRCGLDKLKLVSADVGATSFAGAAVLADDNSYLELRDLNISGARSFGFGSVRCNYVTISRCYFSGINPTNAAPSTSADIHFEQGPQTGHRVIGNWCVSALKNHGISFFALSTADGFTNCYADYNIVISGRQASGVGHGILYYTSANGFFYDCHVRYNYVSDFDGMGIYFQCVKATYPGKRNTIIGNYVNDVLKVGTGGTLIDAFIGFTGSFGGIIRGNILLRADNIGSATSNYGIRVADSEKVLVTGNQGYCGNRLRAALRTDTSTTKCLVTDNDMTGAGIANTSRGIDALGTKNRFFDNRLEAFDNGIVLDTGSIDCTLRANETDTCVQYGTINLVGALRTRIHSFEDFGSAVALQDSSTTTLGLRTVGIRTQLNKTAGTLTLIAGTLTVATTAVTANSRIFFQRKTAGGVIGTSETYTIIAGTSFTITSNNAGDTSTFDWWIVEAL